MLCRWAAAARCLGFGVVAAVAVPCGASAAPSFSQVHSPTLTCAQLAPGSKSVVTPSGEVVQGTNIAKSADQSFVISYEVEGATVKSWTITTPETPPAADPGVGVAYVRYKTPNGALVAQGNYYEPDNGLADATANFNTATTTGIYGVSFCITNVVVPGSGSADCIPTQCSGDTPYWVTIKSLDGETKNETCACNFEAVVCDPANDSTALEYPPCIDPGGESIDTTPTSLITWANSGACSSRLVKVGGQWVCLTPKK